jgi:hypothetical protein
MKKSPALKKSAASPLKKSAAAAKTKTTTSKVTGMNKQTDVTLKRGVAPLATGPDQPLKKKLPGKKKPPTMPLK